MSGSFRCLLWCPEIGNAGSLSLEKPPLRNWAKMPEKRWFLLSFVWGCCCNYLINSGAKFCDFLNGVEVGSILRDSRDGRACSVGQRSVFHRPMQRVASGGTTRSVGLCRLLLQSVWCVLLGYFALSAVFSCAFHPSRWTVLRVNAWICSLLLPASHDVLFLPILPPRAVCQKYE